MTFLDNKLEGLKAGSLDTLAQLATKGQKHIETSQNESFDIEFDSSTSKDNKRGLLKRARRKYFTTGFILKLIQAAEINEDAKLLKAYWNSYHCAKTLVGTENGKITGKYCKNRWCLVCNAIRTAQMINYYKPILDEWNDAYMVTLTVPNCKAEDLSMTIDGMQQAFVRIKNRFRQRYTRGKGSKFIGLRKLECTYNPVVDTFHPHYHLLVRGKDNGVEFLNSWLATFEGAVRDAQDIRKADENSCIEMFKYFTKVISDSKKGKYIYTDALDVIFNAVRGKRTFQTFGFSVPKIISEDSSKKEISLPEFYYVWEQTFSDWICLDTGELLTDYRPSEKFRNLIENRIVARNKQQ